MPLHTFVCTRCDARREDLYYKAEAVPRFLVCKDCRGRMHQTWARGFNRKRSLTTILGPNTHHHPQFGTDVHIESADHYRQLCKEYEMEEADDAVGGNKDWRGERLEEYKRRQQRQRQFADLATDEQVRDAFGNI